MPAKKRKEKKPNAREVKRRALQTLARRKHAKRGGYQSKMVIEGR